MSSQVKEAQDEPEPWTAWDFQVEGGADQGKARVVASAAQATAAISAHPQTTGDAAEESRACSVSASRNQ